MIPGLIALLAIVLAGCTSLRQADSTEFYVLSATPAADAPAPSGRFNGLLFVAPVELASYLEHPGIVVRRGTNRVEFTERHEWAQPLRNSFTQVLREDLVDRLGTGHVHPLDRQRPRGGFLALHVRLDQFELVERKEAVLSATWQLTDGDSGKSLRVQTTRVDRPVAGGGGDFSRNVAALSAAVAELSDEIVASLEALPASRE